MVRFLPLPLVLVLLVCYPIIVSPYPSSSSIHIDIEVDEDSSSLSTVSSLPPSSLSLSSATADEFAPTSPSSSSPPRHGPFHWFPSFVSWVEGGVDFFIDRIGFRLKVTEDIIKSHFDSFFSAFVSMFQKEYSTPEEESSRMEILKENSLTVADVNGMNLGFGLGIGEYGDFTTEEFAEKFIAQPHAEIFSTNYGKFSVHHVEAKGEIVIIDKQFAMHAAARAKHHHARGVTREEGHVEDSTQISSSSPPSPSYSPSETSPSPFLSPSPSPPPLVGFVDSSLSDDENSHWPEVLAPPKLGGGFATSLDWRKYNVVSPSYSIGSCPGCFSFATAQIIESHWAIYKRKFVKLSEQQFLDCSRGYTSSLIVGCQLGGCQGGCIGVALEWAVGKTLYTEESYPFVSGIDRTPPEQRCKQGQDSGVKVLGLIAINPDVSHYMAALQYGPIGVYMYARTQTFISYTNGIIHNNPQQPNLDCYPFKSSQEMNENPPSHTTIIVGYDIDPSTKWLYWIVKNSWGQRWGENGFFRVKAGDNVCGIERMKAFRPVVDPSLHAY